jgi:protein-tyrosine kinase
MSHFFKALEQAERDRLREQEAGADSAPPRRTTPKPNLAPAIEATMASPLSTPTAPEPEVVTPMEVVTPISKRDFPAPSPTRHETEFVAPAASSHHAPSPASVFRPALRARVRPGLLRGRSRRRQPLLVAQMSPNSIEADSYRLIRAKIELMASDRACRNVAITSVTNGDGKSTSAANLAVVAAQGGRRVCLVDGDLRRPTLHDLFGLANVDGLASALINAKPLHTVARPSDIENLSVVVAGRGSQENFQDLLRPERLGQILQGSELFFDLVLFDTPPVIAVADTLNVASACDGVILVVRAGSVPFSVLRRAVEQIAHVKGRVLGVLLNRVNLRGSDADFYRYYRAYHTTEPKG